MKDIYTLHLPLVNNLSDYMAFLRQQIIPEIISDHIGFEDKLVHSVTHLLKSKVFVYGRIDDARNIIEYICDRWVGKSIRIFFPLYTREMAYMMDAGKISISLCFLFSSGGLRVLKVLLHELAHWWIAQQNRYERLLALDGEYIGVYGTDGENFLLSPIEYLATILSIELMENLSSALDITNRSLLISMADDEKQRVKTAIHTLCL